MQYFHQTKTEIVLLMGNIDKLNHDEHFKNYVMFYEYFHGDNGRGVGASHQTGWTSTVVITPKLKN